MGLRRQSVGSHSKRPPGSLASSGAQKHPALYQAQYQAVRKHEHSARRHRVLPKADDVTYTAASKLSRRVNKRAHVAAHSQSPNLSSSPLTYTSNSALLFIVATPLVRALRARCGAAQVKGRERQTKSLVLRAWAGRSWPIMGCTSEPCFDGEKAHAISFSHRIIGGVD